MNFLRNVLLMSVFLGQGASAFFSMEVPQGFLWYKDKQKIKKPSLVTKATSPIKTARQKHEDLKIAFEDAVHESLDSPTIENVKRAQFLQKKMIDKSEAFSKTWMVATLDFNGTSDPSLSANPLYLKLSAEEKTKKRRELFSNLSKTYGVFYLFDENCPYCHSFFPVVQKFCKTYGFEIVAVSKQGVSLKEENGQGSPKVTFLKDNGIIERLNTKKVFPAVFLANVKEKDVMPISWGMSTITELEDNLERTVLFHKQNKESKK